MDTVGMIMAYEMDELGAQQIIDLFVHLANHGQLQGLQGHYGRTFNALVKEGFIERAPDRDMKGWVDTGKLAELLTEKDKSND